jgi:hypothetical protein
MTEARHGSWFGAFPDSELAAEFGLIPGGMGPARYKA